MCKVNIILIFVLFVINIGVILGTGVTEIAIMALSPSDPSSFSRPDLAVVTNIFISLDVNFERKVFSGNVDLTVKKINASVDEVILDSDGLQIEAIYDIDTNKTVDYVLADPVVNFGSKLTIKLPPKDTDTYVLSIRYETSPSASGLQWLTPEQTAGKVHPFLFSQFQPIHARSVLPCQDTPSVKSKYTANIFVSKEFTAVMSAILVDKKPLLDRTVYHFVQEVPIPSYLIAFAVGDLQSKQLGPRSHVWAEKELIDEAKYEFANTEQQLKTAEEICGPYVWGIYDLLVLPPSFPFGGMENPCLTFVTPTVLAGDRSLADVVAHEIAHSWTGNLVTNCNFEHFWLNEGFTVFLERKIVGRLATKELQDFDALCGLSELRETIDTMGAENPLTKLVPDLKGGVHPDDAFSKVPYEKGQTFLRYLENVVGGPEQFEPFMRKYFDEYKYKSICTDTFKTYFETHFKDNGNLTQIDWDKWLYSPGMPPVLPDYDTSLAKACNDVLKKIINWKDLSKDDVKSEDFKNLMTHQKIHLLQRLLESDPQSVDKIKKLEALFELGNIKNAELKCMWLRIGIKAKWEAKIKPALDWINVVGRMKFVRPLYRDLYNWEEAREQAIENYKLNKNKMMHVVAYTAAKDLHLH